MIKIFKNKFLISMFLLVVSVIITSSCYASETVTVDIPNKVLFYHDLSNLNTGGTSIVEVPDLVFTHSLTTGIYNSPYVVVAQYVLSGDYNYNDTGYGLVAYVLPNDNFCGYYVQHPDLYSTYGYDGFKSNQSGQYFKYNFVTNEWDHSTTSNFNVCGFVEYSSTFNWAKMIWASKDIYAKDNTSFCLFKTAEYSDPIDTSFDYSFEGIKRGQTKLSITNLDFSLRMYGYVGLDIAFSVGDTLDINVNTDKLRLMATRSDNSDLYCYLSEEEEVNYYIVDENNVILDTGYISEMAKGYFLYGFKVNNGVDFVFLKDGQVYWDNTLTFKYNTNNSNVIQSNDIVSMSQSSYIETNKTVAAGTYTGYVFDSSGTLLVQADCDYGNNLSSLSINVDTSYFETHTLLKHISCYWLQSITLTGTNPDGSSIDFSNYKVQWSVPTWVTFESIEFGFEDYGMRSGTLTGFTSTGVLSMFNLQLFENLSDHTRNFDITLQVYDGSGNLVLIHVINSDNIVANQIKSEENNVDKGDYDIVDNPGYTGGSDSNYGDISNIQNWTVDDYANLMSTDNFVWEFFKAILGNLPWWITTPLTILIFGVVFITIIRFARGA